MKLRASALTALILSGFAAGMACGKDPALQSLTMEHFRDTATVADDPPDATVISTENGFKTHSGPLRMVWNDEYLRTIIDNRSGKRSFQVDTLIIYSGSWRSYDNATYGSAGALKSVPVIKLGREVANCAVGECTYTEHIAFPIDEESLRREAAVYAPVNPTLWAFTLVPERGPPYTGVLSSAEFAGLLAKVDAHSNVLPAVRAQTVSAALKLDLGIAGMPVAGSEDHPDRAGLLITGVDHGSVAQKSGIIIGDILYEFAGRPIKAPAELQAAVAACAANSAVTIKVYRGTKPTDVTAQF